MGNRCGRHAMRIEKQKARTTRLINRSTFRGYSLSYARTNGCHWAAWPVGIRLSSFGCFFFGILGIDTGWFASVCPFQAGWSDVKDGVKTLGAAFAFRFSKQRLNRTNIVSFQLKYQNKVAKDQFRATDFKLFFNFQCYALIFSGRPSKRKEKYIIKHQKLRYYHGK